MQLHEPTKRHSRGEIFVGGTSGESVSYFYSYSEDCIFAQPVSKFDRRLFETVCVKSVAFGKSTPRIVRTARMYGGNIDVINRAVAAREADYSMNVFYQSEVTNQNSAKAHRIENYLDKI